MASNLDLCYIELILLLPVTDKTSPRRVIRLPSTTLVRLKMVKSLILLAPVTILSNVLLVLVKLLRVGMKVNIINKI